MSSAPRNSTHIPRVAGSGLILLLTLFSLVVAIPRQGQAAAATNSFQYGYDLTGQAPGLSSQPADVSARAVMSSLPGTFDDVSIMGWGVGDPEPSPGVYDFSGLQSYLSLVQATGGTPVLSLVGAPEWMTGATVGETGTNLIPPTPAHYADFAALSAKIAAAFPQVKYFVVWRELQGFWNSTTQSWDMADYTTLYNDVYNAIKAVRPDALVGGPYMSLTPKPLPAPGNAGLQGPWGFLPQARLDGISYWLANKVGADFVVVDGSTVVAKANDASMNNPITSAEQYAAADSWLKSQTTLPIWWVESHIQPDTGWTQAQAAAARVATLTEMAASGASVGMQWQPQQQVGWPDEGLWTTLVLGGGQPTRLASLMPAVLPVLSGGVWVVAGQPAGVLVATGPQGTIEINTNRSAATAIVNSQPAVLAAGQVTVGDFTDTGPPGVPLNLAATTGNTSATVTFSPPTFDGGSPVTSYTLTAADLTNPANGGQSQSGTGSPITVTGLTDGDKYSLTVTATNSTGTGTAPSPVEVRLPITVPGAPVMGSATASSGRAAISFTPPVSDGGKPIWGYTVTAIDLTDSARGGQKHTGRASPVSVYGLTNGDQYQFTVASTNAVGIGPSSSASNVAEPATTPTRPVHPAATAGIGKAVVTFSPPTSDGGMTISRYRVVAVDATTPGNGGQTVSGPSSPLTVTGLVNGDKYSFSVTATNAVGTGPASTTAAVVPARAPDAPVMGTATPGNGQATVSFSPPVFDGGKPISGYTVTAIDVTNAANGGQTHTAGASPITVGGLTNGDKYKFTVTAANRVGSGPASAASNVVTPAKPPTAPQSVAATAGDAQAVVRFSPPASDGGMPVTGYTVTAIDVTNSSNGGQTASGTASPITVTGLTNGDRYRFTVTASNVTGTGPASPASSGVIPTGP